VESGDAVPVAAGRFLPDQHDALRVLVGQGLQQHAAHKTEDGGVGSDTERERQERNGGEAGRAAERTQGIAHGVL
jgi:hypothetical protein